MTKPKKAARVSTSKRNETAAIKDGAYEEFLRGKVKLHIPAGFEPDKSTYNRHPFPFQRAVVTWALRLGRAALFETMGLGKTIQELEIATQIHKETGGQVVIACPLCIAKQTEREADKFGYSGVSFSQDPKDIKSPIILTNYDQIEKFESVEFSAVLLDESSILKSFMGKTKQYLIQRFAKTPYRYAASATPAPNDHLELGNHAEFLGIMPSNEMIARWFINDTSSSGNYRLKEHARVDFWRWVASWAVCATKPSDLGDFSDEGYILPALNIHHVNVDVPLPKGGDGELWADAELNATKFNAELRRTLPWRVESAAKLTQDEPEEPWVMWCNLNPESEGLQQAIPGSLEVTGSQPLSVKEDRLQSFVDKETRVVVTKPKIAGHGLNWQHCARAAFVGLSYSFEALHQAIGRFHRFGQEREVDIYLVTAATEGPVLKRVLEKRDEFLKMQTELVREMKDFQNLTTKRTLKMDYELVKEETPRWTAYNGDCVDVAKLLPDNSIDFSIYSPPFSSLYIYSDSIRDMGNCEDDAEFFAHYIHLISEHLRIQRPGRLVAIHCKNLVDYMNRDGASGIRDFRGDIVRAMESACLPSEQGRLATNYNQQTGRLETVKDERSTFWKFHSEVTVWKDPVVEQQRTKAHGLLHKTIKCDSSFVRQGIPDYLCIFRKWTKDEEQKDVIPIYKPAGLGHYVGEDAPDPTREANYGRDIKENYSINIWQRYASPVWFDIRQTDVLNVKEARSQKDCKHICPLQIDLIRRAVHLWTLPGELVYTPFLGIGSEIVGALRENRRGVGSELKPEYFHQAKANCHAETDAEQMQLPMDNVVHEKEPESMFS